MRTTLLTLATLAATALSAPESSFAARLQPRDTPACMTDADAQQVATNFKNLIAEYSDDLADAALTTDFHDYTDSVIELINNGCGGPVPLGSATFSSLEEFKKGQGAQPPIPFEQLALWHTCDTVMIRWVSKQDPQVVAGNIVMETVPAPEGNEFAFQMETVYSEFNSGAWLANLGIFKPDNCTAAPPAMRMRM